MYNILLHNAVVRLFFIFIEIPKRPSKMSFLWPIAKQKRKTSYVYENKENWSNERKLQIVTDYLA